MIPLKVVTSTSPLAVPVRDVGEDAGGIPVEETAGALSIPVVESTSATALKISGLIDPDARAFATASGATDVAALSAFAKAMKAASLWTNFACWPHRSTQNAGTGTTIYSFGGLGTYNGTMVNGPSWGANGLTYGTDDYISTALSVATNTGNWSCGIIFQASAVVAGSAFLSFSAGGKSPAYSASTGASIVNAYLGNSVRQVTSSTDWTTAFRSLFCTKASTVMTGYVNGSSSASGAITTGGTDSLTFRPGGGGGNPSNAMTAALAFYTTDVLTAGQATTLHGIIRDTLCTGLSLP